MHEFGSTAVPNSIWDKPGPLTRPEFDRVELHPMLTERMLRRSPALAVLNPVAAAHHDAQPLTSKPPGPSTPAGSPAARPRCCISRRGV